MEYEEDTHLCLSCHATVVGLDNYVTHRKSLCPAAKARVTLTPSTTSGAQVQSVGVDVNLVTPLPASTLSPSTSGVDPNIVLYTTSPSQTHTSTIPTDPSISDFLSSLDLQIRSDSGQAHKEGSSDQKGPELSPKATYPLDSRLSSILNDLEFSSDSEGFIPSDADDILNFSDDDEMADHKYHTGGKWKPGASPGKGGKLSGKLASAYRSLEKQESGHQSPPRTGGKWKPGCKPQTALRGKWRPGEAPQHQHHTRGKWKSIGKHKSYPGEEAEDDEEDNEEEEEEVEEPRAPLEHDLDLGAEEVVLESTETSQVISKAHVVEQAQIQPAQSVIDNTASDTCMHTETETPTQVCEEVNSALGKVSKCVPCQKSFVAPKSYERHLKSAFHLKQCGKANGKEKVANKVPSSDDNLYECTLCCKSFNTKYNFARHLLTSFHARRAKTDPANLLDESQQILLLRLRQYQCRICSFYCNSQQEFLAHSSSESHKDAIKELVGPVLCVRCKEPMHSNTSLLTHLQSTGHVQKLEQSGKPCIVRERRNYLICPVCKVSKYSTPSLLAHMKLHKNKAFVPKQKGVHTTKTCTYCKKTFRDNFNLALHIRRRHTTERPFLCKECNVSFVDQATWKLHYMSNRHLKTVARLCEGLQKTPTKTQQNSQGSKLHKCGWCSFVTSQQEQLRPHYLAEHAKKIHECQPCGMIFKNKRGFDVHMRSRKHKEKEAKAEESESEIVCPVCSRKFYDLGRYQLHELSHMETFQEGKDKSLEVTVHPRFHSFLRSLNMDLSQGKTGKRGVRKENVPSKVTCPECNKEITLHFIISHLRQHSGTAPFKCVYCFKCFTDGVSLQRHLRGHLGIKPFKCKHCPQVYCKKSLLMTHMYKVHKDPKTLPHACTKCDKSFTLLSQLNVHMKRHSNDRQFECTHPGCGRKFLFNSELLIHKRCHSQERHFLCDQCGYAGRTRNQLTRHRRMHTGEKNYHCEYCTFKASNNTNLRRHMRLHTGVRPYKCPYCDYTCNAPENIRKHIVKTKKHFGLKVYPCILCKNAFSTNSSTEFKDHLKDCHQREVTDSEVISVISGLYRKDQDMWKVPEGSQALPLREPIYKRKGLKKDHDYTIDIAKPSKSQIVIDNKQSTNLINAVFENEVQGTSHLLSTVQVPLVILAPPMVQLQVEGPFEDCPERPASA